MADALFVRSRLTWFEQIDGWCNTRPIVERLGQMLRLDRRLFCQLGNALRDREYARDLLSCELELPDHPASRRWQAPSNTSVGRGRLRASVARAISCSSGSPRRPRRWAMRCSALVCAASTTRSAASAA